MLMLCIQKLRLHMADYCAQTVNMGRVRCLIQSAGSGC